MNLVGRKNGIPSFAVYWCNQIDHGSTEVRFVRTAAIPLIEMLRYQRTAAMGKMHCGIALACQSRLRAESDARAATKCDNWCSALVGGSEPLFDVHYPDFTE